MKKLMVVFALTTVGVIALGAGAAYADDASAEPVSGDRIYSEHEAAVLWAQVREVMRDDPNDFVAIQAKINELYSDRAFTVSVEGYEEPLSAEQATAAIGAQIAARAEALSAEKAAAARGDFSIQAISGNAVSVAFAIVPRPNTGVGPVAGYGTWDIDNGWTGGGGPRDVASIQIQPQTCIQIGNTYAETYPNVGQEINTNYWVLADSGVTTYAPVITIDDTVGNGVFLRPADHGYMLTDLDRYCGPTTIAGQFKYEHNQGGGAVANISVGWGFLNVGYSGGPVETLPKSTQPVYYG